MFFISAMNHLTKEDSTIEEFNAQTIRCFGYYKTLEAATEAVINNYCDIFEYSYTYAVIEEIDEGIHAITKESWWFRFNAENGKYDKIIVDNDIFTNYAIG